MQKFINNHKNYLLFVVIVIGIGILVGILYYQFLNQSIKENVILTLSNISNFKFNNIIKDLIIMSLLLISSFFIIGIPLGIFYIFYESFSLGFLLNALYATFKIKGIIYFLLYFIINKLIVLLLMIFFIKKIINISRYIIGYLIYRKDSTIKDKIMINFKKCLYTIIIVLVVNLVIYVISPGIFSKFALLFYKNNV